MGSTPTPAFVVPRIGRIYTGSVGPPPEAPFGPPGRGRGAIGGMAARTSGRGWRPWACAAALVLAGGGLWHAWSTRRGGELSRARAAYERGDWGEAATLAAAHLKRDGGDPEALRLMARA